MQRSHLSRPGTFILLVAIFSAVPYALIIREGSSDSDWMLLLMLSPALAAIVCTLVFRERFGDFGWRPRRPGLMLLALALPLVVEVSTIAIALAAGLAEWPRGLIDASGGLVSIHRFALVFGAAPQLPALLALNFLLSIAIASVLYLPFALGEELGWRGYLQRHATGQWGFTAGVLFVGLAWGYWHAPAILLGHNFPQFPVLGAVILMPLATVAMSLVMGTMYASSRSIWIPALLHASLNTCANISNKALGDARDSLAVNLTWILLWALFGTIAWWRAGVVRLASNASIGVDGAPSRPAAPVETS